MAFFIKQLSPRREQKIAKNSSQLNLNYIENTIKQSMSIQQIKIKRYCCQILFSCENIRKKTIFTKNLFSNFGI